MLSGTINAQISADLHTYQFALQLDKLCTALSDSHK